MKFTQSALALLAAAILGAALSGCVVVPVPYGYGPYHHYHGR